MATRSWISFAILVALLIFESAWFGVVAQETKPSRDEVQGKQREERDTETIERLRDLFREDRRPKLLVVTGVQRGDLLGNVDFAFESPMVDRIVGPVKAGLRKAAPGRVTDPDAQQMREEKALTSLKSDTNGDLSDEALAALKERYDADIIVTLVFRKSATAGAFDLNMKAVDMRNGTEIASHPFPAMSEAVTIPRGQEFASAILLKFSEQYGDTIEGTEEHEYEFLLVGEGSGSFLTQELGDELATTLEEIRKVEFVEQEWEDNNGVAELRLSVFYKGTRDELIRAVRKDVLPRLKMAWTVQQTDGNRTVVYVRPDAAPAWYALTDEADAAFAESVATRKATLGETNLRRLGIVVGELVDEPMEFYALDGATVTGFEAQTLQAEFEHWLGTLGFEPVDPALVQRSLDKLDASSRRFRNIADVPKILAEQDAVDILLHVNLRPESNGRAFIARLMRVSTGEVLATQSWPSPAANRFSAQPVRADDARQVARFVSGELVQRMGGYLSDRTEFVSVQLRNNRKDGDPLKLIEALKKDIPQITGVTDVQGESGNLIFDVSLSGDRTEFILGVLSVLSRDFGTTDVIIQGETLIIDMKPIPLAPEKITYREAKPRPTPSQSNVAGAASSQASSSVQGGMNPLSSDEYEETMRQNMDSVFTIGIMWDDRFHPSGTGWVVGPNILATNAHVALGLLEDHNDLVNNEGVEEKRILFAARGGSKLNKSVIISKETIVHPMYLNMQEAIKKALAANPEADIDELIGIPAGDVAIVKIIKGEAGRPLRIAATEPWLYGIKPLDKVSYIGFPMENIKKTVNYDSPVLHSMTGEVVAISNFFLHPDEVPKNQLLHTNLVTAGGASGSPYFNERGEVIGVNSAGSYSYVNSIKQGPQGQMKVASTRIRTGIAYGQRADLVLELLEGKGVTVNPQNFK